MQAIDNADAGQQSSGERKHGTIIGCIDDINECGVFGWAYSETPPHTGLSLKVYIDGVWISDIACRALRDDVLRGGHPVSEVGFHIWIPEPFCDNRPHVLVFRDLDDQDVAIPRGRAPAVLEHGFTFAIHFDAIFYADFYLSSIPTNGLRELKHWKGDGARSGNAPNSAALFASLAAEGQVIPDDFCPQHYRFLNRDLSQSPMSDWQLQLHFLQFGERESRPYKVDLKEFEGALHQGGGLSGPKCLGPDVEGTQAYTSIIDMFSKNGCTSTAFIAIFKVEDYVACYPAARLVSRLQCIRHFLEFGRVAMSPIAFDCRFDAAFYIEIAQIDPSTTAPDAYLHWLNFGIDNGLAPGPAAYLRRMGLKRTHVFPASFDPMIFAALNPDLDGGPHRNRWEMLQLLVDRYLVEGRPGCKLDTTTCELYLVVADRLAIANSLQSARTVYEKVLTAFPLNTWALRHYGDCLLKLGEFYQAAGLYQKTIDLGQDNVWTHINQATCYCGLRRWSDAAAVMSSIASAHPADWGLGTRSFDVAREGFDALSAEALWLAQNGFYDEARVRMEEACGILTRRLLGDRAKAEVAFPRTRHGVTSLAIIADLGLPQCTLYRVIQKSEQLTAGGIGHRIFDVRSEIGAYLEACGDYDALLLYRVPITPMLAKAVETARQAGQVVFYEIDDLMFDPACFPASFASYGGQVSHDDYASLVTGAVCLRSALCICDYAIASTSPLADAMAPFTIRRKAFVHRNGMGAAHQRSAGRVAADIDAKIRLFYGSGTKAHNEDFEHEIAPNLVELFKKHRGGIHLVIMGYLTLPEALKPYAAWITQLEPIWDIEVYWSVLRTMSINIAVLSPGRVADCKSEIKWLEAAMFEIPSAVTATATYEEIIRDGETGILIRHAAEWFNALDRLICSSAIRKAIGAAARQDVLARYAFPALSANIKSILDIAASGGVPTPKASRYRILVVHVFFPPQSFGGATRVVADNIADMLDQFNDEFEIEVFTTGEGRSLPYLPTVYQWHGIRVTGISTPVDPDINMKVVDDQMGQAFAAVVERFRPDLIHFHCIQRLTTSLCVVAQDSKTPYVITLHDAWWLSDQQFIINEFGQPCYYKFNDPMGELRTGSNMSLKRMLAKQKCLQAAAKLYSVSAPFAQIYRAHGFGNIITIENGLPPFTRHARHPSSDGIVRIAHIGGTSFHKGYHLIASVLTAGNFINLRHLQIDHSLEAGDERTDRWGATDVLVRSSVPQRDIGTLYAGIDVLLAPSIWPESYGLVVREALAAGCWIVTSDRGAIGQDVAEDTGFIIDVGSHGPLRDVLQTINDDPARFTKPPVAKLSLRTARQQATELAEQYRDLQRSMGAEPKAAAAARPRSKERMLDQVSLPKRRKLKGSGRAGCT